MKKLATFALGGFLLATPTAAQSPEAFISNMMDMMQQAQSDRWDRDYDRSRYREDYYRDYERGNTYGGSYGQDSGPRYGFSDGDRHYDRRSGTVREYRDGKDYCYMRGDRRNGWSC